MAVDHKFRGIALHTWTIDTTPLEQALAAAKAGGFDAVELRRVDFVRNPNALDLVKKGGLPVACVGVEPGWIFSSKGEEQERLFGVFLGPLEAEHGGHIEQSGDTDGRIHQKARHRRGGAVRIALEHLVDRRHRLAEIVEEVAHALLCGLRHPVAIDDGDGAQRDDVDDAVEREQEAVGRLDRVPDFGGAGVIRRTSAWRQPPPRRANGAPCASSFQSNLRPSTLPWSIPPARIGWGQKHEAAFGRRYSAAVLHTRATV